MSALRVLLLTARLSPAAGGMAKGHVFKAYQPGGPSAGILPAWP